MKYNKLQGIGWIIIVIALLSAVAIYFIKDFSWIFLIILLADLLASGIYRKKFSRNAIAFCRILVGCLFIFSGFVKGVDPMGTIFKMKEYMTAYGAEWAMPIVPFVAILMITAEFSFGFFAVLNLKPKFTSICISLMMIGFTTLTFLDALNNPVSDCGCFGDFVKMTNWQTFYKNLVIDTLLIALVFNYDRIRTKRTNISQFSMGSFIVLLFTGMQVYAYFHQPILDFLPWKVGTQIVPENRLPVQYYYSCENKNTGEIKEFLYEEIAPYLADSTWNAEWKLGTRRDVDPNPQTNNLRIADENGNDVTSSILESEFPSLVATIYDLEKCHVKALVKLEELYYKSMEYNYNFYVIVSAPSEEITAFVDKHAIPYSIYTADDVELKMMNRSNPGVILLQNNRVQYKWNYNNLPDFQLIEKIPIKAK